eukprot:536304_1
MSVDLHAALFICESRTTSSLVLISVISLIIFVVIYIFVFERYCIGNDPNTFFESPTVSNVWMLILSFQFIYYMIFLLFRPCRNSKCMGVKELIVLIYAALDVLFTIYLSIFRDSCAWNSSYLGIDSMWNALVAIIMLLVNLRSTTHSGEEQEATSADLISSDTEHDAMLEDESLHNENV